MKKIFLLSCLFVFFTRETQAQKCGQLEWNCKSGECIPLKKLCDGTADCTDRSDERPEECLNVTCPTSSFRCADGACIDLRKKCDGKKDCADNSDEKSQKCLSPISEDSERNCVAEEMQCNSGKCVPLENACDGQVDCDDQSDETSKRCASLACPPLAFRCSYGACIDGGGKCNGVVDCVDGSDETTTLCGPGHKTKRAVANRGAESEDGCLFDPPPNVIAHYTTNADDFVRSREIVPNDGAITYKCQPKYALTGSAENFCEDHKWKNPHPTCTKYCNSEIISGITFHVSCERFGDRVPCHGPPILPQTHARVTCNVGYRKPFPFQEILVCDENGEWDYHPKKCEQICGVEPTEATPLIRGGEKINNTLVPWHVGIYSNKTRGYYEQICGGTIISAKLVISAAHCFWNPSKNLVNKKSYYAVAAGKYYRDYYAEEPLTSQFLDIEEIVIPNGYKDVSLSYAHDIAMIVVARFFEFTAYIRPVCIDWLSYNQKSIRSDRIGIIAGWGRDASGESSEVLKAVKLPTVSYEQCVDQVQAKYRTHVTGDKFCVAKTPGHAVCKGDSGGGFSIAKDINGIKVYYLWGIVSVALTELEDCSKDYFTVFTNIQFYNEMIMYYELKTEHITERAVASRRLDKGDFGILNGCSFDPPPNVIAHYATNADDFLGPGEIVADYDSIVYKCRPKHALIGPDQNFCEDEKWNNPHPNCTKYCKSDIIKGITFQVSCERFGTKVPCHGPPILPNTRVRITCNVGYRKPFTFQEILICGENGEWDYHPTRCEQVCGVENLENIPFIIGGEKINNTPVPWHVGIYSNRTTARYEQICGGTIISAKLVISAAHCFWNTSVNVVNNKSYYAVAAGKYYRDYYAEEPLPPQFLQVEEIAIPNGYKDTNISYVNDIAMIIVARFFEFTVYIHPVCIEWLYYNEKHVQSKRIGIMAGWGRDTSHESSEVLKAVKLPTVSYKECVDQVEPKYKTHVTGDKFCVAKTPGNAVCKGDSGGGFSITKNMNGIKVYYLSGILSDELTELEDCSNDYFTVFTNIQFYNEIITHYEVKTRYN